MKTAVALRLHEIQFFLRNVQMRLPFRYGKACLVAAPLLHTRLIAEDASGKPVMGISADMLPPKWFDKDPAKNFRDNITDLLRAAELGASAYLDAGSASQCPFRLWREAYGTIVQAGKASGLNALTASFGSSIIERAVIDAACRAAGIGFHASLRENVLGIVPGDLHTGLDEGSLLESIPEAPLSEVYVRHTIGIGDPIHDSDIPAAERLNDGIPQSVEEWIRAAKIHYFKIKVTGHADRDLERLETIAALLAETKDGSFGVSMDGNEQFGTLDALLSWFESIRSSSNLDKLLRHVRFIEQPIERSAALSVALPRHAAESLPPLAIDESDDHLDAFQEAVQLGYRGTSIKNCKGVFQGIGNRLLAAHYRKERGGEYFLTAEDLCNQPIVPLQQDLCTVASLGIEHVERNGHHYVGTLDHLPEGELEACLGAHASLYERFGKRARLKIRDGRIALDSLQQPGYGVAPLPDFESMTPASAWHYESLGLDGDA